MDRTAFEDYLGDSSRLGPPAEGAVSGSAGGARCGDLVRISLALERGRISAASFDAEGCAASRAAAAAACELLDGAALLEAARLSPAAIAAEVGGLSRQGAHAGELAADAAHRALSGLAGSGAQLAAPAGDRVLVALSGGVDSAVAALLARRSGTEVAAVTVKLWSDPGGDGERSCCSPQAVLRARDLANRLGLPHLTLDLREQFRRGVVERFLRGHREGTTPNPCVACNGEVRLDAMVDLAGRLGARGLATGHYARIVDDGAGPLLARPADESKDQTHMLAAVTPETLARLEFPLAELTKPEVRRIAAEAELPVAGRAESQDLCFLAGVGKRDFLRRHGGLEDRTGEIVDTGGRPLGTHPGHHNFTVGQRRGVGVAAGEPLYVVSTDAGANRVVVGRRDEIETRRVRLRAARLLRDPGRVDRIRLRHHSRPLRCRLEARGRAEDDRSAGRGSGSNGNRAGGELIVRLAEPARAAAPGQTASLLDGDVIVGHGIIA